MMAFTPIATSPKYQQNWDKLAVIDSSFTAVAAT